MESINSSSSSCFSNTTADPGEVAGSWAEFAFLCLLFILGVMGNVLVVVVYKPVRTKSVHLYFVFWLGIIDFVSSIFMIPNAMAFTWRDYIFSDPRIARPSADLECNPELFYYRICVTIVFNFLLLLSCFLFVGIAIDRLDAITSPLNRRFHLRAARVFCLISSLFTMPFVSIMVLDETFEWTHVFKKKGRFVHNISKIVFDVIVILCFVSIVVVYILVFLKVYKLGIRRATLKKGSDATVHNHDFDDGDDEEENKPDIGRNGSVETFRMSSTVQLLKKDAALMRRTILIAVLITICFGISWLPVLLIQHWQFLSSIYILRKIVHLNSVANPLIYAATNQDFRESVHKLFSD